MCRRRTSSSLVNTTSMSAQRRRYIHSILKLVQTMVVVCCCCLYLFMVVDGYVGGFATMSDTSTREFGRVGKQASHEDASYVSFASRRNNNNDDDDDNNSNNSAYNDSLFGLGTQKAGSTLSSMPGYSNQPPSLPGYSNRPPDNNNNNNNNNTYVGIPGNPYANVPRSSPQVVNSYDGLPAPGRCRFIDCYCYYCCCCLTSVDR
jgi:hypothetical protein